MNVTNYKNSYGNVFGEKKIEKKSKKKKNLKKKRKKIFHGPKFFSKYIGKIHPIFRYLLIISKWSCIFGCI